MARMEIDCNLKKWPTFSSSSCVLIFREVAENWLQFESEYYSVSDRHTWEKNLSARIVQLPYHRTLMGLFG